MSDTRHDNPLSEIRELRAEVGRLQNKVNRGNEENAKLRAKAKGLVEHLKDSAFSLPDRISNAIKTLEHDDG